MCAHVHMFVCEHAFMYECVVHGWCTHLPCLALGRTLAYNLAPMLCCCGYGCACLRVPAWICLFPLSFACFCICSLYSCMWSVSVSVALTGSLLWTLSLGVSVCVLVCVCRCLFPYLCLGCICGLQLVQVGCGDVPSVSHLDVTS